MDFGSVVEEKRKVEVTHVFDGFKSIDIYIKNKDPQYDMITAARNTINKKNIYSRWSRIY